MAKVKAKVKTANTGLPLKYVFVTGDGRNGAMPGEPENMIYSASCIMKKDSPEHKALVSELTKVWDDYKVSDPDAKGTLKTAAIKPVMVDDPSGEIDPETEKVKKIPTDEVIVTFKTGVKWPDGNKKVIKKFDHKGNDITVAIDNAQWSIGEGSTGIIHGIAEGNKTGGKHKVTLYLQAVQLAKLIKYEGDSVDASEIDGEDLDLGDYVAAVGADTPTEEETPAI